jgi:hypothetical protein
VSTGLADHPSSDTGKKNRILLTEAEGQFHLDYHKEDDRASICFEGNMIAFPQFVGLVYNNVMRSVDEVIQVVSVNVVGGRVVTLAQYIKSNGMAIARTVRLRRPTQKFPADLPKTAPTWYAKFRRTWPAGFGNTGEKLDVSSRTIKGLF